MAAKTTQSGVPVNAFYGPADAAGTEEEPGKFPFTRGIHPTMYRERLWTMRQYAGLGTAAESNARFKTLLAHGQTGLSVAFDLPTQMGLDSDDPRALGEVGQVGVAIDSLADMEEMFEGIPLDRVSTSMTINAPAATLTAMYAAVAEKQGHPVAVISGTAQNDILKEYVARGTFIFPPRPSMRLAVDLIEWCAREAPKFNAISVSGYHMRDAGLDAVREMAFALSNAVAYGELLVQRGVDPDAWGPRVSWIFNTHNDFFEEVAKYRALRRMWARIMKERFGAKDPRSWMLRTHTQTGGSTCTAQQPENNIVRAAYQALAAVLGGVQSLALSCFDEALAIPTEKAQQIALRTQQILAHETGVTSVADPLGGSHYVEWLTGEMERRALAEMEKIAALGGAVAAVEQGHMQRAIADAAYQYQQEIDSGRRVLVGVNRFTEDVSPTAPPIFRGPADVRARQTARIERIRAARDGGAAQDALRALAAEAAGTSNLVPHLLRAVKAYCTVGEIHGALRAVWGGHTPAQSI